MVAGLVAGLDDGLMVEVHLVLGLLVEEVGLEAEEVGVEAQVDVEILTR